MKIRSLTLLFVPALSFLLQGSALGNFLSYVDENGTRHIVQSEDEVPEKFRKVTQKSQAGDPKDAIFYVDDPFVPDPKDSPRTNCEKEANYNFAYIKKKLFKREGALLPEEMKTYSNLVEKHELEKKACQKFAAPETAAKKEKAAESTDEKK
ncbi:MAG: hypothetical protein ACXVB9_00330 [Bdellovibrionota bacterium]